MRLQKFLSEAGIASRRKSEILIQRGLIKINKKVITKLGTKIDINKDIVFYRDKRVFLTQKKIYIMLNKPCGFITTLHDEFNRPNVMQLVETVKTKQKIFPVGRLDCNTSGLLLLTNDGELTYKLTHPKHDIFKIYKAKLDGVPDNISLRKFCDGLIIDGKKTKRAYIKIIRKYEKFCFAEIKISEGRNRQIRKMCETIGHRVLNLKRIAIGNLRLDIKSGEHRFLTESEINYLKSL